MRNSIVSNTATTASTTKKNGDMLDILLKLSHTEREAVLKAIKEGNKMVDEVEIVYGVKDRKDRGELLFIA